MKSRQQSPRRIRQVLVIFIRSRDHLLSLRTRCNQPRQRTEDRCRVVEHLPDESRRCNVWSGHCIQHGRQFGKLPLSLWIHGRASFCTGRCISVQLVEKNVGQSKHWPVSLGHVHPPLGNAKHIFWVLNHFFCPWRLGCPAQFCRCARDLGGTLGVNCTGARGRSTTVSPASEG